MGDRKLKETVTKARQTFVPPSPRCRPLGPGMEAPWSLGTRLLFCCCTLFSEHAASTLGSRWLPQLQQSQLHPISWKRRKGMEKGPSLKGHFQEVTPSTFLGTTGAPGTIKAKHVLALTM